MTFQAGPLHRVVGEGCLDDAAALVARRSEDLLQQQRIGLGQPDLGVPEPGVHLDGQAQVRTAGEGGAVA